MYLEIVRPPSVPILVCSSRTHSHTGLVRDYQQLSVYIWNRKRGWYFIEDHIDAEALWQPYQAFEESQGPFKTTRTPYSVTFDPFNKYWFDPHSISWEIIVVTGKFKWPEVKGPTNMRVCSGMSEESWTNVDALLWDCKSSANLGLAPVILGQRGICVVGSQLIPGSVAAQLCFKLCSLQTQPATQSTRSSQAIHSSVSVKNKQTNKKLEAKKNGSLARLYSW